MTHATRNAAAPKSSMKLIASTVAAAMLVTTVLVPLGEAQAGPRHGGHEYSALNKRLDGNRGKHFSKRGYKAGKFANRKRFNKRRGFAKRHYNHPPAVYHAPQKRKKNIGKIIAIGAGIAALAIIAGAASKK